LGEQGQLLRLVRDFVEAERRAIWKYHRQGALGIEVVKELTARRIRSISRVP
jgi:hypothetical protein